MRVRVSERGNGPIWVAVVVALIAAAGAIVAAFVQAGPPGPPGIDGAPIGTVLAWVGPTDKVPRGWKLCHGQELPADEPIFALIGDTYGSADGGTKLKLPDFKGYFLRGLDPSSGRKLSDEQQSSVGPIEAHVPMANRRFDERGVPADGPSLLIGDQDSKLGVEILGTGNETRPVNMAVHWIIKIADPRADDA